MGFLFIAIIFLAFCDVFDATDGYVARRFDMSTPLGIELDSLVDVTSFVVPPFLIGLLFFQNHYVMPFAMFYVCCGVFRLARFNVEVTPGYFIGLPVSIAAHLIYLSLLLHIPFEHLPFLYPIIAILTVSPFKLKKRYSLYLTIFMVTLNVSFAILYLIRFGY